MSAHEPRQSGFDWEGHSEETVVESSQAEVDLNTIVAQALNGRFADIHIEPLATMPNGKTDPRIPVISLREVDLVETRVGAEEITLVVYDHNGSAKVIIKLDAK